MLRAFPLKVPFLDGHSASKNLKDMGGFQNGDRQEFED
jgi:hypothetical protein